MICQICELDADDVRPALAQWKHAPAPDKPTWAAIPRCVNREACAARVAEAKREWPLVESSSKPPNERSMPRPRKTREQLDAEHRAFVRERAQLVADGLMDPRPPTVDEKTGEAKFRDPLPMPQIPLPEPDPLPTPKKPTPPPPPPPDTDPSSWW